MVQYYGDYRLAEVYRNTVSSCITVAIMIVSGSYSKVSVYKCFEFAS